MLLFCISFQAYLHELKKNKTYLSLIHGAGSLLLCGLFSHCRQPAHHSYSPVAGGVQASYCGSFSCGGAQVLGCEGFSSCGSQALEHGIRSCGT